MPTISKLYDIKSLIEHYAQIQVVGQANVNGVIEYHSNCPFCGGTDRFVTRPETGQYTCATRASGCGRHGDCIDFLMEYVNMTRQEAVELLDLQDTQFGAEKPNRRHVNSKDTAPSKKWQEAAMLIVERAERYLWHPGSAEGRKALAYLRGRGLKDETIRAARLGCVPLKDDKWYVGSFEDWGLDPEQYPNKEGVKVPDGILIPWFVGGQLWKLAVKRPGQEPPYGQVIGSSEPLYNVDALQYDEICMMVEGELDALSVIQEAGDLVNCVATGSSGKGRANRWVTELSLASFILQSFDEDDAGNEGAEYWLDLFKVPDAEPLKIERWSPIYWNDPNDILKAQGKPDSICTLREWVEWGVALARYDMGIVSNTSTLARVSAQTVEAVLVGEAIEVVEIIPEAIMNVIEPVQEVQIQPAMSLAEHIKQHHEEYRRPYVPVSLPALPRKKCPHRVINEMSSFTESFAGCRGQVLAHGWCEYHAPAHDFLEIGAKLGYPQIFFGYNKARGVEPGLIQWEAYAETTKPDFLKEDCTRLKARYGL